MQPLHPPGHLPPPSREKWKGLGGPSSSEVQGPVGFALHPSLTAGSPDVDESWKPAERSSPPARPDRSREIGKRLNKGPLLKPAVGALIKGYKLVDKWNKLNKCVVEVNTREIFNNGGHKHLWTGRKFIEHLSFMSCLVCVLSCLF